MVIQTFERNFTVIKQLKADYERDVYLCCDGDEKNASQYVVICIKSESAAKKFMPYLSNEIQNKDLEDFIGCFRVKGFLHVVFRHSINGLLKDKLQNEACSLDERLEIGKKILERMLLLNMPCYLQADALKEEHLTVSTSLDIAFHYDLADIYHFESYTMQDVNKALFRVFYKLFEIEIKMESLDSLKRFMDNLDQGAYHEYIAVYKGFHCVCETLRCSLENGGLAPKTIWFRVWERMKRICIRFKKVLAVLLLLGTLAYMIYTVTGGRRSYEKAAVFESIGTVEIE